MNLVSHRYCPNNCRYDITDNSIHMIFYLSYNFAFFDHDTTAYYRAARDSLVCREALLILNFPYG